jgi:hypothetical protein
MELEIQKWLRANVLDLGLIWLQNNLGIYTNLHPQYPNLVQFSYDQIESPKDHPIVRECRGIILDSANNWNVVAYPFNRFFNYGEPCADKIDWSTARVQEKVDGSLIIMYYYDGKWHVATRGSIGASGTVGDWKKVDTDEAWTFKDLFWDAANFWLTDRLEKLDFLRNFTLIFELTSPLNRIVCDYTKMDIKYALDGTGTRLTLIGVRNNNTLQEHSLTTFNVNYGLDLTKLHIVKEFPLTSFDEVIAAAEKLNPLQQEGYVVVDAHFNRVKIKSPKYVALHHLRDGFGTRRLMELIQHGEDGEFLSYFREFEEQFKFYKVRYDYILNTMDSDWYIVNEKMNRSGLPGSTYTQKDFALEAVKCLIPGFLFEKRKNINVIAKDYLKKMNVDKVIEICGRIKTV